MPEELKEFYYLLDKLERRVLGKRFLRNCHGRMNWPQRGVYFFFENGEHRGDSGDGLRVVRVGTGEITTSSRATLWDRLYQHKTGDLEESSFCTLVGESLKNRDKWCGLETWTSRRKSRAKAKRFLSRGQIRDREAPMVIAVSRYICDMPFLWVAVDDAPGPGSDRALIERNAIGLISADGSIAADPASSGWLGLHSCSGKVANSGLWNRKHIGRGFDGNFLKALKKHIKRTYPL